VILEDDVEFRRVLVELLEGEAFDVSTCDSYAALLDSVREDSSLVVLADFWGTSHTDLSSDERNQIRDLARHAPTVLLTGRSWANNTDIADLGVIRIVVKPVLLEDIVEQIHRCMDVAHNGER
jgi:DNA-binding NtrC family response regulator